MANLEQTAHKVVYLASEYPEKTLTEVIKLLALPAIDINTAMWYAEDQGWFKLGDTEDGTITLLKKPSAWSFGPEEARLEKMLLYAFEALNRKEKDLEEFFVSKWTMGYPTHDVLIAIRRLLELKKLHEYQIEDGENNYIFYTLYANRDKQWGRKEFKVDPLANVKRKKQ
jgi:hypothetical protein